MAFKWSYRIARVWGIPIKVHVSLVLILPFLQWDFGFIAAMVLGAGVFATIALHELGHSFIAMRKGCRVREILLLPIGGVAQMETIPTKPADEFLMAIAGPAVSLFFFIVLFFGGAFLPLPPVIKIVGVGTSSQWNVLQILGSVNLAFVLFNLIPAFPMDGGRILRAWLTPRLGRLRATRVAATIGRIAAVLFGFAGFSQDIWTLVLIAVFVYMAAGNEYRAVRMQETSNMFGFPFSPPEYREPYEQEAGDDEVVIGPPPYGQSAEQKTTVRAVRDRKRGSFWKMFE